MSTETRAIGVSIFVLALAGAPAAQETVQHARPEQNDKMPSFSLVDARSNESKSVQDLRATGPQDAPLMLAFVHKDKDLCVRFVKELAKQVEGFGDAKKRCAIHLVFSGKDRTGPAVEIARTLRPPFHLQWDPDRSAYQAMGMIAFPTVYLVDRKSGVIRVLRRGYKISLALEMASRIKVALGLMGADEFDRLVQPEKSVSAEDQQRRSRLREAQAFLRTGKAKIALNLFESVLQQKPAEREAVVGRALALHGLGRADALEVLEGARQAAPDDHAVALALAAELLKRNRLEPAETLIRGSLDARPARAHFLLGSLFEKRERWREAAAAYREAARQLLR